MKVRQPTNRGPNVRVGAEAIALTTVSAIGLALAIDAGPVDSTPRIAAAGKPATVDHVADGDTIQVRIGGREEDVRLIGIDTPEVYGSVECAGRAASASMRRMVKPGDRVSLIRDSSQDDRDYYGRLLRYVELDGRDLGRRQLRRGWASVYVFDEPFDRLDSYRRARNQARGADRGAWHDCEEFP